MPGSPPLAPSLLTTENYNLLTIEKIPTLKNYQSVKRILFSASLVSLCHLISFAFLLARPPLFDEISHSNFARDFRAEISFELETILAGSTF